LNDYNIIDILTAIHNKNWIEIECRDALNQYGYQHFLCFPLMIKENVSNGVQHLIFYHPQYRSVSSIRIDFIDSIIIGNKRREEEHLKDDIIRAWKLIDNTWGLEFPEFLEGNVKAELHPSKLTFEIRFEIVSEKFIIARIKKEINKQTGAYIEEKLDDKYSLIRIEAHIVNPWDMLHWIKTYTVRIYNVKIEYNSFMNDVERANVIYHTGTRTTVSTALSNNVLYTNKDDFSPVALQSEKLFHEIYCETFRNLGTVLYNILSSSSFDENQKKEMTTGVN